MPSLIFDNCCLCIDLKTGSFLIGYLNLIANIILTIVTGIILAASTALAHDKNNKYHEVGNSIAAVSGVFLLIVILLLAFAIILLVGIHQDKPGYVKAYLIYGVVFSILNVIYIITIIALGNKKAFEIVVHIFSSLLDIYFLLVIRSHYYYMLDRRPAIYNDYQIL